MRSITDRLREYCLSFEGAWEDHPWGEGENVFKTPAGKMFAVCSETANGSLTVTLKLTPGEGTEALSLPFVSVARYVGRFGWVTAHVANEAELEITLDWVRRSHELVSAGGRGRRRQ